MKRPHEVLEVAANATPDDIKKAYRKLAQKHHPDRNPDDPSAPARFQEIQEAYQALSRKPKAGSRNPGARPGSDWGDLNDMFGHVFSQAFDDVFHQPRADRVMLALDLETILTGGPHTFDVDEPEACSCSPLRRATCKICHGTGVVRTHRYTYKVNIPPGAIDGMQLQCQNTKRAGAEKWAVVKTNDHPLFKREGADLWRQAAIPFPTLVLGGTVTSAGLRGEVSFTLPAGLRPGQSIRLAGQGLPNLRGGLGDLYLQVGVHIPESLTPRQRAALQELEKALAEA
jgi:DnaJ-class molecular chaperone